MNILLLAASLTALSAKVLVEPCGGTITIDKAYAVNSQTVRIEYSSPHLITNGTIETARHEPFKPSVEILCASTSCPIYPGSYCLEDVNTWSQDLSGTIVKRWFSLDRLLLMCYRISHFTNMSNAVALRWKHLFRKSI